MAFRRTLCTLSTLVELDIGGIQHRFPSSLVRDHPLSNLATWVRNAENGQSGDYTDRNGDRFQYVLDYLRDGKVQLPADVSKGAFFAGLEYFGIRIEDETAVNSTFPILYAYDEILSIHNQHEESMRKLHLELITTKVACMCSKKLVIFNEYEITFSTGPVNSDEFELLRDCTDDFRSTLNQEMAKCGLVFLDVAESCYKNKLTVRFERLGQRQT